MLAKVVLIIDKRKELPAKYKKCIDSTEANTIITRSIAHRNIGERCLAEQDLACAVEMIMVQTSGRLKYLDGDLRENYWNEVNKIIQRIVSLCEERDSEVLRDKLYELILFSKGFLLSSENALKTAIFSENVPENIRRIYKELEKYNIKWEGKTDHLKYYIVDINEGV